MKKNQKLFLQQNNTLPQLNIYMVFVESNKPILFACKDTENKPYICSCHCSNAEKSEWIIAPTSYEQLLDLLTNVISIREIFNSKTEEVFVVTKFAGVPDKRIKHYHIDSIDQNILPTAGYYMDAEEDEFLDEIEELQKEIRTNAEFLNVSYQNKYQTYLKSFCISLVLVSSSIIPPKDYNNKYICLSVR